MYIKEYPKEKAVVSEWKKWLGLRIFIEISHKSTVVDVLFILHVEISKLSLSFELWQHCENAHVEESKNLFFFVVFLLGYSSTLSFHFALLQYVILTRTGATWRNYTD